MDSTVFKLQFVKFVLFSFSYIIIFVKFKISFLVYTIEYGLGWVGLPDTSV